MKRIWKVIIPIILLLTIGVGALIVLKDYEPYNLRSIQSDPNAQLLKSLSLTRDAIEQGLIVPISDVFEKSLKTGSVNLSAVAEDGTQMDGSFYLRENQMAISGSMSILEGEPASYGIWFSEDEYVMLMPEAEGDAAYGIRFGTLKEDLDGSALLDMLGITYEEAVSMLDSAEAMNPQNTEQSTDYAAMLETINQLIALAKSATVSVTEGTLTVNSEAIKSYCISYTLAPAQICSALDIVYTWVSETDLYETAAETDELIQEQMQESLTEAKKFITESNATAVMYFYLNGDTQVISQATCRIDWMENEIPASVITTVSLGADPITSLRYSAKITYNPADGESDYIEYTYYRSHAHNLPGRTLVVSTPHETTTLMDLQYNSVNHSFELKLDEQTTVLSGTYKEETDRVTIELVQPDGAATVTMTFAAIDTVPAVPQYRNLCDLTEDELAVLFPGAAPDEDWSDWEDWEDMEGWDEGGSDPFGSEEEVSVLVCESEYVGMYFLTIGDYMTVGELLIGEEIMRLDENGYIVGVYDESISNDSWEVYIDGNIAVESLNEIMLEGGMSIEIYSLYEG